MSAPGSSSAHAKRLNLNPSQRLAILDFLLSHSKHGKLQHGQISSAADHFGVDRRHIADVWKRHKEAQETNSNVNLESRRKNKSGRKPTDMTSKISALQIAPLQSRNNICKKSSIINVPKTTTHRNLNKLGLKVHRRNLKPHLTQSNMKDRIK